MLAQIPQGSGHPEWRRREEKGGGISRVKWEGRCFAEPCQGPV
jgi:hypothetical protein